MAGKNIIFVVETIIITIFLFNNIVGVFSDDSVSIPADKSQLNSWFDANVKPLDARKDTLDPALVAAEANRTIIKVMADGSGDFKTLTDAINSIPEGNKRRVIVSIGGGNYTEKVKIERTKPFITLYGDPKNVPNIIFNGTAKEYTTVNSATVVVESEYFSAVNINFVNSAPRPDGKRELAQAAALRTGGDKASLYNCKMYGFQDTFCDDSGKHFFKDCYIEGTVDFIFGNGKSLYLNTEMHVIPGEPMAMITAHARSADNVDSGYSFVHCTVTGTGKTTYLGRAWKPFSKVVFSYTDMSDVVHPEGWSDFGKKEYDSSVFYGEYNNKGAGATMNGRVGYMKKLNDEEAKPFISLAYIEGSKWLLPPVTL
ncbi:pectinesterase 1-like [Lycium ferocissimum]|uniref:pectinesterase 1-like n=1 Tax=Lycium ferocissimum TaxID=112874 RepID=UPI0028160BE7|nr:pectinesterase 1-like [Lycium ferocissimum]